MINQGDNVPDNTIAVFFVDDEIEMTFDHFSKVIKKPSKKRDWFDSHFYNCLPLRIANQYGFIITADFGFNVVWNGNDDCDAISITYIVPEGVEKQNYMFPQVKSHFGHGVLTLEFPFVLRTPPGVNLMTINPPNELINNATVMSGVVECDNLRMPFTVNLKIHHPGVLTSFPAGTPIAGFIPIPRYFADNFELKNAEDIFSNDLFIKEFDANNHSKILRNLKNLEEKIKDALDRNYFNGQDVYGNKFPDHQSPSGKKVIPNNDVIKYEK